MRGCIARRDAVVAREQETLDLILSGGAGVGAAIPRDKTGYLGAPTIWQSKATDGSSVSKADLEKVPKL
jgi:hypothetical protein